MFTVKVIKKHGVPYGTPEVLAYVDPDAPGETEKEYFLHSIRISTYVITVITDDNTAFTQDTFAKWLYDNAFNSDNNLYRQIVSQSVPTANAAGEITYYIPLGVCSSNGTSISFRVKPYKLITDGTKLTINEQSITYLPVATFTDVITKL